MKYCKKCLQPDTRPGILFDKNGICYACRYEESKKYIDWRKREKELLEITEWAKKAAKKNESDYDCVIGVSGGKDSFFQALYAKEKLKLNPLLVNSAPDNITDIGGGNLSQLANYGFDIISLRPNPLISRKLAREGFLKFGNIVKASEYALWVSAYDIADKYNIPLVIQGENDALTLGVAAIQDESGDAFSVIQTDTLQSDIEIWGECSSRDIVMYKVDKLNKIREKGIRGIFLQYYTNEWSYVKNMEFAINRGLLGRSDKDLHDIGRYRRYSSLDCDLVIPNQMIKYYKFGFGFATDEACYDIREGRLSRDEAKWYVKEYDGKCGKKYIENACEYMDISLDMFWSTVDKYVNKRLFEKDNKGQWQPKFEVGVDYDEK